MQLLSPEVNYESTIEQAKALQGKYDKKVIFHSYWKGPLNEKHLLSIKSCYFSNVRNATHKSIILWVEDCPDGYYRTEISKYAQIRPFDLETEQRGTVWEIFGQDFSLVNQENKIAYFSNYIRCLVLHKYRGVWFDLDVLFLRSFEPLFANFEDRVFLYTWENQRYPNNAIVCDISKTHALENAMHYIAGRNRGWGFQQADLNFDLPLDFLVLPCSWFDGSWIPNPFGIDPFAATSKHYDIDNFFPGAFCYHWHNQWDRPIERDSVFDQFDRMMTNALG